MYETSFVVYPKDTNALKMDMIYGGRLLEQLDSAASVAVKREMFAGKLDPELYAVTVGVDGLSFYKPAFIGDVIHIIAQVTGYGKTSIKVKVTTRVERIKTGEWFNMAHGVFTFCVVRRGEEGDNIPVEHGL